MHFTMGLTLAHRIEEAFSAPRHTNSVLRISSPHLVRLRKPAVHNVLPRVYLLTSHFLIIVPSEHSSGNKRRQGGITKAGNSHLRRLLVEAAWHYRSYHPSSRDLIERRRGVDPAVLRYANRAGRRLNRKYLHLLLRGKRSQVAVTAISRELAGFLWGAMTDQVA